MPFESADQDNTLQLSPAGFGIQGWSYGTPVPRGITFFLDGSAMVVDQYGRAIRGVVMITGEAVLFAMTPPDAVRDGPVVPRPQYGSHSKVIEAMLNEGVQWLGYEVRWASKSGGVRTHGNMTREAALERQAQLTKETGVGSVVVARQIVCAGWPQLPYEELKKLPQDSLPYTPMDDLRTIPDVLLRKDAMRMRREMEAQRLKEVQMADEEG